MSAPAREWSRFLEAAEVCLACTFVAAGPRALAGDGKPRDPVVYKIDGGSSGYLGRYVVVVGDVDGDGAPDFAASGQNIQPGQKFPGRIDLFSGKDGKLRKSWVGEGDRDFLGDAGLWAFPDIDADGVLEIAAISGNELHVFSPTTGKSWYTLPASEIRWEIAMDFLIIPDLDGDGVGEVVEGAGMAEVLPFLDRAGRVRCRSGRTGELIWTRWGVRYHGFLGAGMVLGGDEDGDGMPDVLCRETVKLPANPYQFEEEQVIRVLSSRTGAILRTYEPPGPRLFWFGYRMASLGDRDGDGFPEVAIAAPFYREPLPPKLDNPHEETGRYLGWVGVFQLPDFRLLFSQKGRDPQIESASGDSLGISLAPAGDVDGDGITDLLAGTDRLLSGALQWYGRLYVISGADGRTLAVHEVFQEFSQSIKHLVPLGDIDGDGRDEFILSDEERNVYTPWPERVELHAAGAIHVLRYHPDAPRFIRGDANGDGRVDITDALVILRATTQVDACSSDDPLPPGLPACPAALDVNASGCLDHLDAVLLLQYLFKPFHFTPTPPFPDCGQFFRIDTDEGIEPRHLECRESETCAGP